MRASTCFLNRYPIIVFRGVWETNYSIVLCSRILHRQYDRQTYTSAICFEDSREYYRNSNVRSWYTFFKWNKIRMQLY